MRSLLLRVLLLSSAVAAGYAGSTYTHFEPELREAGAQELTPVPDPATATPTATATQAPTPAPTDVAPPPIATSDIEPPAPTSTATAGAPSPTDTTTATATASLTTVLTTTPTPAPPLPPVQEKPDNPEKSDSAQIGPAGGRIASSDGRAVIDVPSQALVEVLTFRVTKLPLNNVAPPSPDFPLVGLWSFEATTNAGTDVHQFNSGLTVSIRFTPEDLHGRDPATLRYWSLDHGTGEWSWVPGDLDVANRQLTVQVDHFSHGATTASPIVDVAPLLLSDNVGLQTGSAVQNVPIEVAPGRGGLAPALNLSYDSMRVEEMRAYSAVASWAGVGWDLGTGSVQIARDPSGTRFFLEGQGFGGEMMQEGAITGPLLAHQADSYPRVARLIGATWAEVGVAGNVPGPYREVNAYGTNLFRIKVLNFGQNVGQLQRSADSGATWQDVGPTSVVDSNGNRYGAYATAGGADGAVYLLWGTTVGQGAPDALPARVYKSVDGGSIWVLIKEVTELSGGWWATVVSITAHPSDPLTMSFHLKNNSSNDTIWKTTDGGANFTRYGTPYAWPSRYGPITMLSTGRLVTVEAGYFAYSDDNGVTWTRSKLPDNVTDAHPTAIIPVLMETPLGNPGVAFMVIRNGSIARLEAWRTSNNGANWEQLYDLNADLWAQAGEFDKNSGTLYVASGAQFSTNRVLAFANAATVTAPATPIDYTYNLGSVFGTGQIPQGGLAFDPANAGYVFRTRDEQYVRVRSGCIDGACPFTVTDKSGTQYVYGTDDAHRRWYLENNAGTWVRRYYRLDLAYVIDVLGNRIDYTYWQQRLQYPDCTPVGAACEYVIAAYPEDIFYNYENGLPHAQVHFDLAYDNDNVALGRIPATTVRKDAPYDVPGCGYVAPRIVETRKLTAVHVKVRDTGIWQTARRYDLEYGSSTSFDATGCAIFAGQLTLDSVAIKGRDGASTLSTMTFGYSPVHHAFVNRDRIEIWGYNWRHLTQAANGFGAVFNYEYALQDNPGCYCARWDRAAVTRLTSTPGASQPPIVNTFAYSGLSQQDYANPNVPYWEDAFSSDNRGYASVTETDASGNRVLHFYYAPPGGLSDGYAEARHGRELLTRAEDASGNRWHETSTTWTVRPVANYWAAWPRYFVNFVYPSSTTTTLRDGTVLTSATVFDDDANNDFAECPVSSVTQCFGLPTRSDSLGVSGTGDDAAQKTVFHKNTASWIFAPQYSLSVDPAAGDAMLSCTKNYYDGAKFNTTQPTRGLLTASSTAIAGTAAQCQGGLAFTASTNAYTVYDAYGNVVQSSVPTATAPEDATQGGGSGWVPSGVASSSAAYDTTHRIYPTSQTNAAGHQTSIGYDFVLGKPTLVTAPTGHFTAIVYDTFGRVIRAYDNKDSDSLPTVRFTYNWGGVPNRTLTETRTVHTTTSVHSSVICMDGFGRTYETREQFSGTTFNSVRMDYDARGLVAATANAVSDGASSACPATPAVITTRDRAAAAYDPFGNVTTTTFLAANQFTGPSTLATYSGLATSFRDERLNTTTRTSNPLARTLAVTEPSLAVTTYANDKLGRLTGVTDAMGNVTSIGYDLAGRKTSMADPDMGGWTYGYNAAGGLTSQTDARAITTTLAYDVMQRLTGETYSNGDPAVAFMYDTYPDTTYCTQAAAYAIGMLTRMTDSSGQALNCYDVRGRTEKARHTVSGTDYDVSRTFDPLDRVIDLTYPDGEIVRHTYDTTDAGLTGICKWTGSACATDWDNYMSGATRTPWGAPSSLPFGMTRTTSYTYDFRQRLKTLVTSSSLQNLTMNYDDASNVSSVANTIGTAETVTYSYDNLNRLTGAAGFTGGGTAGYAYNAIGNLLTKQEGASNLTLNYPASGLGSVRPHAVTSTTGTQALTLAYDANGNLATQGSTTYTFDAENRLKQRGVSGGTVTYLYDGNGATVKRTNADGTWTVYVEGIFEKTNANVVRSYYHAYGRPVAMRDAGTVYYLTADHLGGTAAGLKKQGNGTSTQWALKYWPFGATRTATGTAKSDKMYTGQRQETGDAALGLYNYNARFYSTTLGRFVSADPVVGSAGDPQSWNAYTYVRNNPARLVDPSGLCPGCEGLAGIGGALASVFKPIGENLRVRQLTDLYSIQALHSALTACTFDTTCPSYFDSEAYRAERIQSLVGVTKFYISLTGILHPAGDLVQGGIAYQEGNLTGVAFAGVGLLPGGLDDAIRVAFRRFVLRHLDDAQGIRVLSDDLTHASGHLSPHGVSATDVESLAVKSGRSLFLPGEDLLQLVTASAGTTPYYQASYGRYARIVVAPKIVGYDIYAREYTAVYTVVTRADGTFVTTFPGIPQRP